MLTAIIAPNAIPRHAVMLNDSLPGSVDLGRSGGGLSDVIGAMNDVGTPPPPAVKPQAEPGPLRISAGVAA